MAELTELFQLLPRRSRVPRPPSDLPHNALIDELLTRIRACRKYTQEDSFSAGLLKARS